MARRNNLTIWQRVGRAALGLACLAFCVFAAITWHTVSPHMNLTLWNTENIQPHLTGNVAVDQQIVRQAGYSNDMLHFMAAAVLCGWAMSGILGIRNIYFAWTGSKPRRGYL